MISFSEALEMVLEHAKGCGEPAGERVALAAARGRVLAGAVVADRDQPPFSRATRDGFAGDAVEFGRSKTMSRCQIVGSVAAGSQWSGPKLGRGEVVEIMTGAPMPEGADAVVMVEHVIHEGDEIWLAEGRSVKSGENFVPTGAEAKAEQTLLRAGVRIGAAEIGLAASVGYGELEVYRKPRVAVLATGDELVEINEPMLDHQIRNSNSYTLAALIEESGGEAVRLPIARDTKESLRERLAIARGCDLMLLSGGVSAGKYDLVEVVLEEMGAEFYFTGVAMQPGKPAVFGKFNDGPYFFGLPGNPVSTQVTFLLFAVPMLRALSGAVDRMPRFAQATAAEHMKVKPGLTRFLPARMESGLKPMVKMVPWQGSGDLAANAVANCYAVIESEIAEGATMTVLLR